MKEAIEYIGGLSIVAFFITALAFIWIGGEILIKVWLSEFMVIILLCIVYSGITKGKG